MAPSKRARRPKLAAAILVGGAAATLLASCSSSPASNRSSTTTTAPHRSTTTTSHSTTSTSGGSTTTTGGSTTTTGAHGSNCSVSQLSVAVGGANGAAGTIFMTGTFTNTSPTTCTLQGYPGMQLLDAQGHNLPTNVVRGGMNFQDPPANQPPSLVTLAPQQAAQFDWSYSDVPVGNQQSCPMSSSALVTPPNDFTSATISLQIPSCGNGTIHVSPVFPAT